LLTVNRSQALRGCWFTQKCARVSNAVPLPSLSSFSELFSEFSSRRSGVSLQVRGTPTHTTRVESENGRILIAILRFEGKESVRLSRMTKNRHTPNLLRQSARAAGIHAPCCHASAYPSQSCWRRTPLIDAGEHRRMFDKISYFSP